MTSRVKLSRGGIALTAVIVLTCILCSVISILKPADTKRPDTRTESSGNTTVITTAGGSVISEKPADDDKPVVNPDKNVVCIDAGHGWGDNGSTAVIKDADGNAVYEKDINLSISGFLRDALNALGYETVMIRESDDVISPAGIAADNICNIKRRVTWVNGKSDIDLMISIHCDSDSSSAKGPRIYFNADTHDSMTLLGDLMANELYSGSASVKKPIIFNSSDLLYSLKNSVMPSILIECGFISNQSDAEKLTDPEYCELFAGCLARAIDKYFTESET